MAAGASVLHDPGVMSDTRNSDLVGPGARFPHLSPCDLCIASAGSDRHQEKGPHGLETPLQALCLWFSSSKDRISWECDTFCQEGLSPGVLCRGQSVGLNPKMRCETCLTCASFKTYFRGFGQWDETFSPGASV